LKLWIFLEVGAHILSDQCLNQEVENTSVMPCLLAPVLFQLMLQWGREKKVDMRKQDNPTRENCRFGASREDLFPTSQIPNWVVLNQMSNLNKQHVYCSVNFKFTRKSEGALLGKLQVYAGLNKFTAG
jgi:hypothetical protein